MYFENVDFKILFKLYVIHLSSQIIQWLVNFFLTPLFLLSDEEDGRRSEELEELMWNPDNGFTDRDIDQFQIIARWT